MKKEINTILIIPVISIFCSIAILIGIYPYRPNSFFSWIALFVLALPIVLIGELIGDKALKIKYVSKLSSPMRIVFGVVALSIFIICTIIILNSSGPFLGKWGK
jgi:hypothetical protein